MSVTHHTGTPAADSGPPRQENPRLRLHEAEFPSDAPAVSALLAEYLHQTEAEKAAHGLAVVNAQLPDRYAREIADPAAALASARVLLASVNDQVCGMIAVTHTADGIAEIKRFWTSPAARGRGIGTALISAVLAHTNGPVRLSVWAWREPAIRLYLGLGFAVVPSWDAREQLVCCERPAMAR